MKQTSKYAIVFLAGAIFATAGSAYGAEAIKIISAKLRPDIKVSVNGKQLDASAISYNNTTYLPLRKAAEAIGGKIELNGANINIITNPTKQKDENDIKVIKNYYEGSDALIINGETFITIVTGRNKYNLPNDFTYSSSLRTLGFKGLPDLVINIDDRYTTNSTAFYYGTSNHVYVNESFFISIKNQLSE